PGIRQAIGDQAGQAVDALAAVEGDGREGQRQGGKVVAAFDPRLVIDEVDGAAVNKVADQRAVPPMNLQALFHHFFRVRDACLRCGASKSCKRISGWDSGMSSPRASA